MDGNVKRVLSRLFLVTEPVNTTRGEKAIWALAEAHLPQGQAGAYNQALMDLGATICLPRQPDCAHCPVADYCQAYAQGKQEQLPVKNARPKSPHYTVTAAVIQQDGRYLIAQRAEDALLGGMWEFPGGKREEGESLKACLQREILEELQVTIKVGGKLGVFKHAYTHFKVTLHAYYSQLTNGEPTLLEHQALQWVTPQQLDDYPMGKIDRQIAQVLQQEETHDA